MYALGETMLAYFIAVLRCSSGYCKIWRGFGKRKDLTLLLSAQRCSDRSALDRSVQTTKAWNLILD